MNLTDQKTPPDQADNYWDAIVAAGPPLASFTREMHRSLSEDRRTLKFTITDAEQPSNAFVPGATEWSGSHDLSTNQQSGFRTWACGIQATYTAARGVSMVGLYKQFLALVTSRIRATAGTTQGVVLSLDYRVSDQLHGQEVSFAFRWTFVADIAAAVQASGLWLPIPGAGWSAWALSMARTALAARGNAQLAYSPATDTLIDLCDQASSRVLNSSKLPGERRLVTGLPGSRALQATLPPAGQSWLHYESHLVYAADQGAHVLRTLPPAP